MGQTFCKQCPHCRKLLRDVLKEELAKHSANNTDASITIQQMIDSGNTSIPRGTYLVENAINIPLNMEIA